MSVEERVKKVVAEQLGVEEDKVVPGARFGDDLGADSLDGIEIIMAVEDKFGIEISDEEAEGADTVQGLIDLVTAKQ